MYIYPSETLLFKYFWFILKRYLWAEERIGVIKIVLDSLLSSGYLAKHERFAKIKLYKHRVLLLKILSIPLSPMKIEPTT